MMLLHWMLCAALWAPIWAAGPDAKPDEAPPRSMDDDGGERSAGGIVKFGEDVEVREGEEVDGPVVSIGGSVRVDGEVNGPVVAVGGSTLLGPRSSVDGPAVSIGGRTSRSAGSRIDGPIIDTPGVQVLSRLAAAATYLAAAGAGIYFFAKASAGIGWIVLGVVLVTLFPKALRQTKDFIERKPVECCLAGLLAWPCLCVISLTMLISIIGLPLLPILAAVAAGAYVWGFSASAYLIGERLALGRWKSQHVSMIVGMLLLKLLQWVPVAQWLVVLAVAVAGVGAVILSGFGVQES